MKEVKHYIDEYLDPHKSSYRKTTIAAILDVLGITEDDYYWALSISQDSDFEMHIFRPPNSCFVNNYFTIGLQAWEANIDIQPVFNYYKAVTYMCSYFSKCETESSVAMKNAAKESENLSYQDRMKKLAIAFLTNRQCSLQEAVYQLMPELWLRKTFPVVTFANSNLPEKRYKICKSKDELSQLPEDSTDVFKRNNLDRYIERPDKHFKGGKFSVLDEMCYAEFLAFYVLETKPKDFNDSQPEVLVDDGIESPLSYPRLIPLMRSKDKMRCRSVKKILRYHTPNANLNPEEHAHHLLMLFYPFRNEQELCEENSFLTKLNQQNVLTIVNENREKFEPFGNLVEESLIHFTSHSKSIDSFAEQENDDLHENVVNNDFNSGDEDEIVDFQVDSKASSVTNNLSISNEEINLLISQLNQKQREIFNVINRWARQTVQNRSSDNPLKIPPLRLFITGNAGTGKSFLIKTLYSSVSKTLNFRTSSVEKPKVLLLAPTGVAAINISGTTIHSGLGIPVECRGMHVPKLSDKKRCALRVKYEELKMIIIDEISMVSNKLMLYIHQRLVDIFGYAENSSVPFAGITIIFVGDLYQLPPVLQKPIYADYYCPM